MVITGPAEATAIGNLIVQIIADKKNRRLSRGKKIDKKIFYPLQFDLILNCAFIYAIGYYK